MSDGTKAVFLSYASQDAEAAKRIADALRAAGVEVWFDAEGGLEHGDEWDRKIRRQIKECVLFIPIISAHTEEREEGYFRLEWDLAAERARNIASGVAFILPVVIDGTKDSGALVPDRFRAVQWTKLPGGNVPPEILQRFLKLWSHRTGALKHAAVENVGASLDDARGRRQATPLHEPSGPGWKIYAGLAVTCLALAAGAVAWLAREDPPTRPPITPAGPRAAAVTAPATTEVQELVARIWGIYDKVDDTSNEEWGLAEELGARATKLEPLNAEAWAAYANVICMPYIFGIDSSPERAARATKCAERAVSIAPESVQARLALANVRRLGGNTMLGEAIGIIRALLASEPSNRRVLRMAGNVFRTAGQYDEAVHHLERAAALPGGDRVALFGISRIYLLTGRLAEAEAVADRAGALTPGPGGEIRKLFFQLYVHDDLAAAEKTLAELPGGFLLREEGADYASTLWLWLREADKCASVLNRLAGDTVRGIPNGLIVGWAYRGAGREAAAALQWQETLQRLEAKLATAPSDTNAIYWKIRTLASLGRRAEAAALLATYEQLRPADTPARKMSRARMLLQIGRHDEAFDLIDRLLAETIEPLGLLHFRGDLRHDPMFDAARSQPRFKSMLARMDAALPARRDGATASLPDDKSVAVLAFANLSDDKANEYFSDGISEELLNVLAKVPKLKVAARTSSFYFKGRNEPIPEIAQKLGVAYVVEGSVRKAGNKVRITAQLIKAADGFHVWSETYDRDLTDIFAMQDEIAKNILGVVKGSLLGEAELPHATTTSIEAYTIFLRAQGAFAKRGIASLEEAVRLFEAALAIDPDYVPALTGLAQARVLLPIYANLSGAKADAMTASGRDAAERALKLEPGNATAQVVLGWALVQVEWRWRDGLALMLQARDRAPNNAWIWNSLGDYYRFVGDLRQALVAKRREWELDPLSSVSHWDFAYTYQVAGDYDQTMHWAGLAISLAPHNLDSYNSAILITADTGRLEKMREMMAAARREVHENEGLLLLLEARCAIAENKREQALRILAKVEPLAESGDSTPAYLGYLYLLLGESKQAARWMQQGYARHDGALVWPENIDFNVIAADPVTRPILDQPGLKELYELRQRNARAGLNKL